MTLMPTNPADLLTRLEEGFQSDAEHLRRLGSDLRAAIEEVRRLAATHGASNQWSESWSALENSVAHIQALAGKVEDAIGSGEWVPLKQALEAQDSLHAEEARMVEALRAIRDHVVRIGVVGRDDWNTLARAIDSELNAIHAGVEVLRIKLELMEGRTPEQVSEFVRDVIRDLRQHPCPEGADPRAYELEYLKASIELEHEKHQALGFPTNIKTLFTWMESPEERVQRKLHLPVD